MSPRGVEPDVMARREAKVADRRDTPPPIMVIALVSESLFE